MGIIKIRCFILYDIIIIGAGPTGITAAVYAARKKLKTLVITENIGGQAALSGEIDNYTGFQFISGPELALKFEEHLKKFDVELREFTKKQIIAAAGQGCIACLSAYEYLTKNSLLEV